MDTGRPPDPRGRRAHPGRPAGRGTSGLYVAAVDIHDRKQWEERTRVVSAELDHRVQTLRALYGDLLASEARHFGLYWVLCEQRYERGLIIERLEVLAQAEVKALEGELVCPEDVRMHSCGVDVSQIR